MEANQLPTKPGPYYWRVSDGGEWEIAQINRCMDVYFVGCDMHYKLKETGGEWLPIPTAEELVELKAAKKMVDEKHDGWAIFQRGEFCLSVPTQNYVIRLIEKITGCPWMTLSSEANYTCEPVTIVRKAKR
jgi:hypothetical protein